MLNKIFEKEEFNIINKYKYLDNMINYKKISGNCFLILKDIPKPTERQLKFKLRKCSRCGREFHPNIGTQPTCMSCFYIIKCTYCKLFYKPEPARIINDEQTKGNHFCCKKHGDIYKTKLINSQKRKAAEKLNKIDKSNFYIKEKININDKIKLVKLNMPNVSSVFVKKKCNRCGRDYYPFTPTQTNCGYCYYETKCDNCNKILKINQYNKITDEEKTKTFYCSKCSREKVLEKLWKNEEYRKRILSNLEKGVSYKFCNKCKKKTIHAGSRCKKCNPWRSGNPGFELKECLNKESGHYKEKTLHIGNRCFLCNPWKMNIGFELKKCINKNSDHYNEITRHLGNRCIKCNPLENTFNRDKFYNSKFNFIDFEFINKKISWRNIDPLNNIPGVWAVWASDNKCLDVCQTINIGSEMLGWIRNYNACRGKSDEELIKMNKKYQKYNRKKKRDIAEYCSKLNSKPIFKLVAIKIKDKKKREDIEAQYAHDNKALFWSPAPGQKLTKIS